MDTKPTATQVRVIDDAVYRKTLYRLTPPLDGRHGHVLLFSSPAVGFWRTNANLSDESGGPGKFVASVYGKDEHAEALRRLGYTIEPEPVHIFTDESTHVDEIGGES